MDRIVNALKVAGPECVNECTSDSLNDLGKDDKIRDEREVSSLGFFASYPLPRARIALVHAFRSQGLTPQVPSLPRCVVQWAPYSRLQWQVQI